MSVESRTPDFISRLRWPTERHTGRLVAAIGLLALLAVGTGTGLTLLRNLPFSPVAVPDWGPPLVGTVGLVAGTAGLLAVGVASAAPTTRVGLTVAATFGVLASLVPAATIPGVVGLTVGGSVAVVGLLHGDQWLDGRLLIATGVVSGMGVTLTASTGLLDGSVRGIGSWLVFIGMAALITRARGDPIAMGSGAAIAVLAAIAAGNSPYVVGSVLLVAFGVVGAPHLLAVLAIGCAVAAGVAGVRHGDGGLAIGAPLLLLAGMPTTPAAALAVLFGAMLVVGSTNIIDGREPA